MNRFEQDIAEFRREKNQFFKTDPDSPIPSDHQADFKDLNYYPPEKNYRVRARLKRFDEPKPVLIATSTGSRQSYIKYGILEFEIQATELKLIVYKSTEDPFARSLFVPFSDETSSSDTYGSGRYLDLEEQGGDDYELDFNMAYNPYCAYSERYTCPIPPEENRLPIKILAGEKKYK